MSAQFIASVMTIVVAIHVILIGCSYLILLERKVCAWVQDRIGPNRTGFSFGILPTRFHFWGLGQPLADGIKLFFKEDYTPPGTERCLFLIAPVLIVIPAILAWAVVPWGGYLDWGGELVVIAGAPLPIGVIYILAMGSLAVYGVVLGGYASNNKYSFIGGLRATAQMLSYEIPMGLCVLIIILVASQSNASVLVDQQANGVWYVFHHPLLAIIFYTCVLAECNRAPFDLAEAEQELVGGYHTEYTSMKWALFFVGEYMHMITGAAFCVLLFLGGWDLPIVQEPLIGGIWLVLLKCVVFATKAFLLLFVMIWIRWTLPRLRFDQLMRLAWRGLIPVTLTVLLVTSMLAFWGVRSWYWHLAGDAAIFLAAMIIAPFVPAGAPVNRRVRLEGSRFHSTEAV